LPFTLDTSPGPWPRSGRYLIKRVDVESFKMNVYDPYFKRGAGRAGITNRNGARRLLRSPDFLSERRRSDGAPRRPVARRLTLGVDCRRGPLRTLRTPRGCVRARRFCAVVVRRRRFCPRLPRSFGVPSALKQARPRTLCHVCAPDSHRDMIVRLFATGSSNDTSRLLT